MPEMNPRQYEEMVAEYYRVKGYSVELTAYTNDYGVDCLACRDGERIAVQAKMYGKGIRAVNRKMLMELYGAMRYFDCHRAVLVTDGELLSDAWEVAAKLSIEVVHLKPIEIAIPLPIEDDRSFERIWSEHVIPMAGKTIFRENGQSNTIVEVDWSGLKRITSNGRSQKIPIEVFRSAINQLRATGKVERRQINNEFAGRASSGICLILSNVPFIRYDSQSSSLVWRD